MIDGFSGFISLETKLTEAIEFWDLWRIPLLGSTILCILPLKQSGQHPGRHTHLLYLGAPAPGSAREATGCFH